MGWVVVHLHPYFLDRVVFIAFGRFFMDGSGGRVAQICWYLQKIVNHFQHKILLLKPLLLLNQAGVGNSVIHPYQIKCTEHGCHPNLPASKIMAVIINQLV